MESIDWFATCPPYLESNPGACRQTIAEAARSCGAAGCRGMLIEAADDLPDPWLVAQVAIDSTRTLEPMVAVDTSAMHPYTVAKMVTSIGFLRHRRVCLCFTAGESAEDSENRRVLEYAGIVRRLLESNAPVSFDGEFYRVVNLSLKPPLARPMFPLIGVTPPANGGAAARLPDAVALTRFTASIFGDYDQAAGELRRSIQAGYRTFIVDVPAGGMEFDRAAAVFAPAQDGVAGRAAHCQG